ncbi:hypothetical protein BC936DRAFT_140921 [Jimgerdemannia flammicorona]|uniref:Uncharacterized protein n=1 Tax=Jimgerdemannia flammicorona TaxID=994334 RepID=A0A433A365_9FUNG|nr:hypothetical protein BC936DRAFT_140921 [Jimgerdemannia flammicorona]
MFYRMNLINAPDSDASSQIIYWAQGRPSGASNELQLFQVHGALQHHPIHVRHATLCIRYEFGRFPVHSAHQDC